MPEDRISIQISMGVYEAVRRRIASTKGQFKTVEEYIEFVLTELIREDEGEQGEADARKEKQIKNRLKELGYL